MGESHHRLRSVVLGNERDVWIREPRDMAKARDLIVFLDGEMYRDLLAAPAAIETLGEQQRMQDCWSVYVSYLDVETRARECPCHAPFSDFVSRELLAFVEARWPGPECVRSRVLVGLSYTGLAASWVAMQAPGRFQKVISQSGSYWWNDCWLVDEYARRREILPTEFYLSVGGKETQTRVQHAPGVFQAVSQIDGVRRFRDALQARGQAVQYVEAPGGHDAASWTAALPAALAWALPAEV